MAKKWIGIILIVSSLLFALIIVIFVSLKSILDQSDIKNLVQKKIHAYFDLDIAYEEIETSIFPIPVLNISGLRISENNSELFFLNHLQLEINLSSLLERKLKVGSIKLNDGKLRITKFKNGEISLVRNFKPDSEELKTDKEKIEEGPKAVLEILPFDFLISNFDVYYFDEFKNLSNHIQINELSFHTNYQDLTVEGQFKGSLDSNLIEWEANINLTKDNWHWTSFNLESQLNLIDWNLNRMGDLATIFPGTDLSDSKINLQLLFKKEVTSGFFVELKNLSLSGFKNSPFWDETRLSSKINFDFETEKIIINWKDTNLKLGNHSDLTVSGDYSENTESILTLNLISNQLNLNRLILIQKYFSSLRLEKSKYFEPSRANVSKTNKKNPPLTILVTTNIKNLLHENLKIQNLSSKLNVDTNKKVNIENLKFQLFGGTIFGSGYFLTKENVLNLNSKITKLDLKSVFAYLKSEPILLGQLDADSDLKIQLLSNKNILDQIIGGTKFKIKNGKLLGYANFIKPVAELGKILNFNGAQGESTEFQELTGEVDFSPPDLHLKNLNLIGVGLSANGGGVYSKAGKINMKFTVALSGFVGKMIKLPIIYKGVYGKNLAYVDPVWLASVYTGTLLLGGPAGTMIGGMAGSGASDTIDNSIDSAKEGFEKVKSFFWESP